MLQSTNPPNVFLDIEQCLLNPYCSPRYVRNCCKCLIRPTAFRALFGGMKFHSTMRRVTIIMLMRLLFKEMWGTSVEQAHSVNLNKQNKLKEILTCHYSFRKSFRYALGFKIQGKTFFLFFLAVYDKINHRGHD